MSEKVSRQLESYFLIFGVVVGTTLLFLAAFFTPGYNPIINKENSISSLGYGIAKSLFSVAFVLYGCSAIPFFIYLERELINIRESIRRIATGAAIFTSICIAFVGIIPDETYPEIFSAFHIFAAMVAFIGSDIYITLYCILMYYGPKSKMYTGHKFKKYISIFGFSINGVLLLLFITLHAIFEWLLFICIGIWGSITAITLLRYRFFNIEGLYYKKSEYGEALKKFEESLELLKNLNIQDHKLIGTIQENIAFLKKEKEKSK